MVLVSPAFPVVIGGLQESPSMGSFSDEGILYRELWSPSALGMESTKPPDASFPMPELAPLITTASIRSVMPTAEDDHGEGPRELL
jgi:hypothetical protein